MSSYLYFLELYVQIIVIQILPKDLVGWFLCNSPFICCMIENCEFCAQNSKPCNLSHSSVIINHWPQFFGPEMQVLQFEVCLVVSDIRMQVSAYGLGGTRRCQTYSLSSLRWFDIYRYELLLHFGIFCMDIATFSRNILYGKIVCINVDFNWKSDPEVTLVRVQAQLSAASPRFDFTQFLQIWNFHHHHH